MERERKKEGERKKVCMHVRKKDRMARIIGDNGWEGWGGWGEGDNCWREGGRKGRVLNTSNTTEEKKGKKGTIAPSLTLSLIIPLTTSTLPSL